MIQMIKYDKVEFWSTTGEYFSLEKKYVEYVNFDNVTLSLEQNYDSEKHLVKEYKSEGSEIVFKSEAEIIECSQSFSGADIIDILENINIETINFYLNDEVSLAVEIYDYNDKMKDQAVVAGVRKCFITTFLIDEL